MPRGMRAPAERRAVPMDAKTIAALREALEGAYRARAADRAVIAAFGAVLPFAYLAEAEDRHAKELLQLFERLGVEPPPDTSAERVAAPRTLADACAAGLKAEMETGAMYERLLKQAGDPAARDLLRRLQHASQEQYLPAFRRGLARELEERPEKTSADPRPRRRTRRGCCG